jgi:hypothetical protein
VRRQFDRLAVRAEQAYPGPLREDDKDYAGAGAASNSDA